MPTYSTTAPLTRGNRASLLYDGTAAEVKVTGADIDSVAYSTGLTSGEFSGYPGFTRGSGGSVNFSAFKPGMFVDVSGYTAGNTGSNGLFKVVAAEATKLLVEGVLSNLITSSGNVADSVTIKQAFILRPDQLRSISGMNHPLTLTATTSASLGTPKLQQSPDDGTTWIDVPNVILPDTNNNSALTVQCTISYESLLRITDVGASFGGRIWIS